MVTWLAVERIVVVAEVGTAVEAQAAMEQPIVAGSVPPTRSRIPNRFPSHRQPEPLAVAAAKERASLELQNRGVTRHLKPGPTLVFQELAS